MADSNLSTAVATADVVFVGGPVVTVNSRDEVAEALAVRGSNILRVGDRAYVEQTVGRDTEVVDLKGRALTPGFIDNHIHMTNGQQRHWVDCTYAACPSIADIVAAVKERVAQVKPGEWIWGRGFQATRLADRRNPNRFDLDPVSPDNPVAISNRESMGWTFNTAGLRRMGVRDDTPDPAGGPMERDDQDRPLGPMWDNTRTVFIMPVLPKWDVDEMMDGFQWMAEELNRYGVTTAFEAAIRYRRDTAALQRLHRQASPSLRVVMGPYPVHGTGWDLEGAAGKIWESGLATNFGTEWLKFGALQIGIDGGVIGQTAALFEPYSNDPEGKKLGSFRLTQEMADDFMAQVQANDWQAGLICHGDHGIHRSLEAIANGRARVAAHDLRHRLEHAYLWSPRVMDRMAELGVIWNTQPPILESIGSEGVHGQWGDRARYAFPFKSLTDRGVIISGGSDWPVGNYNPLQGIDILVNHRFGPEEGGEVLNADEGVSVLQAIRIYTYNCAYTSFDETRTGSLEEGKMADLAVLSEDILGVAPTAIRDIMVDRTYVDGRLVFERTESAAGGDQEAR